MNLDEWLKKADLTETAFAKRIGLTQAAVNRYRRGQRTPSMRTARKIIEATSHEVTFADLCGAPAAGDA